MSWTTFYAITNMGLQHAPVVAIITIKPGMPAWHVKILY